MTQPNDTFSDVRPLRVARPRALRGASGPQLADAASTSLPRTEAQSKGSDGAIWIVGFLMVEIVCQLALLVPATAVLRVPLRSAGFVTAIVLMFITPRTARVGSRLHPATGTALAALAIVCLGIFHPLGNSVRARIATVAMYVAIISPLIWVGRMKVAVPTLRTVILIIWAFSGLSALVGMLQTQRPDWQFLQPNLSAVIQNTTDAGEALKISMASGAVVLRPMGLSDQPGGAALAGLSAIVFGVGMLAVFGSYRIWLVVLPVMIIGLYCILLSQVRSVLVMTGICVLAYGLALARRGNWHTFGRVLTAVLMTVVIGATWAVVAGGETVTGRLATLVQEDPRTVYYQNRGHFLEYTLRHELPRFPLGAGLGRWGMVNYYFGSQNDPSSESLWAEINWTGWLYDGGVPLMAAYVCAIGAAIWVSWKLAIAASTPHREEHPHANELRAWAAVVFAYNIGCLAVTFNYPLFMGQSGLDFWLLNAVLWAAAASVNRSRLEVRA